MVQQDILRRLSSEVLEFISHSGTSNSLVGITTFDRLALGLFKVQLERNPVYRKLCLARSVDPARVTCVEEIPALPTSAFKDAEVTCIPPEERVTVFHSSGTSDQKPSRHFHSALSLSIYEASLLTWFRAQSRLHGHELVLLTPRPDDAPRSSLVHMFDCVRRAWNAPADTFFGTTDTNGTWELDLDRVIPRLSEPQHSTPVAIFGTAFSLVHLLDRFAVEDIRIQLPAGSFVFETGGYKGRSRVIPKSEFHGLITDSLGVRATDIVCEYGMSELSSQGYGVLHGNRRLYRFPPWVRTTVISPETGLEVAEGETGLIRVLDLANVYSVMAIQTEDLGIRRGAGFELLGRAALSEPRGCSLMSG